MENNATNITSKPPWYKSKVAIGLFISITILLSSLVFGLATYFISGEWDKIKGWAGPTFHSMGGIGGIGTLIMGLIKCYQNKNLPGALKLLDNVGKKANKKKKNKTVVK